MAVLLAYPMALRYFYPSTNETQEAPEEIEPAAPAAPAAGQPAPAASAEIPEAQPEAEPETLIFETPIYEAQFSTLGATITKLIYRDDHAGRGIATNLLFQADPFQPGILGVEIVNSGDEILNSVFKYRETGKAGVHEFVYEKAGQYRLVKRFVLGRQDPIISLEVLVENLSGRELVFPLRVWSGLHADHYARAQPHEFEALVWTEKIVSANLGKVSKKGFSVSGDVAWAGVVKKYFAMLVKPDRKAIQFEGKAGEETLWGALTLEPVKAAAGAGEATQLFVYAGPQRYETLKGFDAGFENILSRGFFGVFKIWLLKALKFSHRFTGNFGWDILLLTLIIKLLFAPLTHMSYKSMERMKAIQPKLKALQERHKKDPSKMNQEMMELYKKHRVNPMGGCLPMLLQIPIFIAFYQVLNETIELQGAPFIGWINDLSKPDALFAFPFTLPVLGDSFNLLPILMLGSMVVQQRMTPQTGVTPEQQKIFTFMPIIFGFIFYKMPSGLVLYWFLNNVLSIIQQGIVKRLPAVIHHHDEHE